MVLSGINGFMVFLSLPAEFVLSRCGSARRRRTQRGNTSPPDSGSRITFVRITRYPPIRPSSYVSVLEPYLLTMHKRVNLREPSHCRFKFHTLSALHWHAQ